jgi:hypothetical protein
VIAPRARKNQPLRSALAFFLIGHLLLISAMAACPALHELVHSDAQAQGHECAVTLFASGSCADSGPVHAAPGFVALEISLPATPRLEDVDSFFLASRILEHAPPARA